MSFIDDFIYRVKTGRLFAGLEKPDENGKPVTVLEPDPEIMEEISRQLMVLETRLEALEDTNKEIATEGESRPETTEEKPLVIQPSVKKQIGPDLIIHFVLMDKTYIVENFNLNFRQDVDTLRNRPDSFTYGGTMQITLSGFIDSMLNEWISQTYLMRDGEIRFFWNMPKITDSSSLTIFFSDAYCVACKKTIDTATAGVSTTLTVSPRRIRIGNEEFENEWKAKEPLPFTIKSV
jgi:hypothetical protein